jgi:hypothetical protein
VDLTSSELVQNGLDIIVHDRYTDSTKIVNFMNMQKGSPNVVSSLSIKDYESWWDWNLILPDRFINARKKQH